MAKPKKSPTTQKTLPRSTNHFAKRHWPLILALLTGILASLLQIIPDWLLPNHYEVLRLPNIITNSAAVWLGIACMAASHQSGLRQSQGKALQAFGLILLGYYIVGFIWGNLQVIHLQAQLLAIGYWLIFSVVAAIICGHLAFTSQHKPWPLAIIGLSFIFEALIRLWPYRLNPLQDLTHLISWLVIALVGLFLINHAYQSTSRNQN